MALRQATAERGGSRGATAGTDRAGCGRSWRCRGAPCPRSRPDLSRRRRPALKPLFSRAVGIVAWNAVRGCGCRSRAVRRATSESCRIRCGPARALPSRSVGHGRERRAVVRAVRRDVSGPRARNRTLLAHSGHEFGLWRREVSWEDGLSHEPQQSPVASPPTACPLTACRPVAALRRLPTFPMARAVTADLSL